MTLLFLLWAESCFLCPSRQAGNRGYGLGDACSKSFSYESVFEPVQGRVQAVPQVHFTEEQKREADKQTKGEETAEEWMMRQCQRWPVKACFIWNRKHSKGIVHHRHPYVSAIVQSWWPRLKVPLSMNLWKAISWSWGDEVFWVHWLCLQCDIPPRSHEWAEASPLAGAYLVFFPQQG